MEANEETKIVPCCPDLEADNVCDVLDHHYRHIYNTSIPSTNGSPVQVEVTIHTRLERCPGPTTLGDLVYSTTLLPGEKVRLFTTDRRSQFSFDSATSVSYRQQQTSEERYYMSSMSNFMSDVTVRDQVSANSQTQSNWEGNASTSGALTAIFGGASVRAKGSFNASSSRDFLRELNQHAESSHFRSEMGVRASSSVSVGEVQTRSHSEGESEDHFESASRQFHNPNRCQAVSYYFYQINKTQTVKFTIEAIRRRVIDPAADTAVTNNPPKLTGQVSIIPTAILATASNRLEVEEAGRQSILADRSANPIPGQITTGPSVASVNVLATAQPLVGDLRAAALEEVDAQLIEAKLLAPNRQISPDAQTEFSFTVQSSLPTPGLLVRGCLDDCVVCEPTLIQEIEQDVRRQKLENDLLEKQIELLDKSQEYRCCPVNERERGDRPPRPRS